MNFSELKNSSKEIIKTSKPSPISVALVFVLATLLITYLAERVFAGNVTENDVMRLQDLMMEGEYDSAMTMYERFIPSYTARAIASLLMFMQSVLGAGFVIFLLNTVRQNGKACFGNLLDGFSVLGRLILLVILETVFITLWSLLLVVPGIIAAFSYSQAIYIMLDNPDRSVMQCIRDSKAMMKGYKWNCFVFNLSFIGWYILEMIPVARLWTKPYIGTSKVLYYEKLRANSDTFREVT